MKLLGEPPWEKGFGNEPRRRLTAEEKRAIKKKSGGRCALCGKRIRDKDDVTYGHNRAFARGGVTRPRNIVLLHTLCNRKMKTMLLSEARRKLHIKSKGRPKRKRRKRSSSGYGGFSSGGFGFREPKGFKNVFGV